MKLGELVEKIERVRRLYVKAKWIGLLTGQPTIVEVVRVLLIAKAEELEADFEGSLSGTVGGECLRLAQSLRAMAWSIDYRRPRAKRGAK